MCYLLCRGGCSLGFEAPVIVARGQCGSSAWAVAHCVAACGVGFHVAVVVQVQFSQRTYAVAPTMRSAVCLVVLALLHVALAEQFAAFDSASASSVYLGSGDFGPAAAISGGSSYWSSSGSHADGKPVSWTGALSVRRKAIGIKVDW